MGGRGWFEGQCMAWWVDGIACRLSLEKSFSQWTSKQYQKLSWLETASISYSSLDLFLQQIVGTHNFSPSSHLQNRASGPYEPISRQAKYPATRFSHLSLRPSTEPQTKPKTTDSLRLGGIVACCRDTYRFACAIGKDAKMGDRECPGGKNVSG